MTLKHPLFEEAEKYFLRLELLGAKSRSLGGLLGNIGNLLEKSHSLWNDLSQYSLPAAQDDLVIDPRLRSTLQGALDSVRLAEERIAELRERIRQERQQLARAVPRQAVEATVASSPKSPAEERAAKAIARLRASMERSASLPSTLDLLEQSLSTEVLLRSQALMQVEMTLAMLNMQGDAETLAGLWPTFVCELLSPVYEHHDGELQAHLNQGRVKVLAEHVIGVALEQLPIVGQVVALAKLASETVSAKAEALVGTDTFLLYLEHYEELLLNWCAVAQAALDARASSDP